MCRKLNWLLSTSQIGSDPRVLNDRGRNCLHLASQRGELPCIEALVAAGADCDFPDDAGDIVSLNEYFTFQPSASIILLFLLTNN